MQVQCRIVRHLCEKWIHWKVFVYPRSAFFWQRCAKKKPQLFHQNKWFPNRAYSTLLNNAAIPRTILLAKQPLLAWLCCWELCVIHLSLTLLLLWKFWTQINNVIRSLNQQSYISHISFLHMEEVCRKEATIFFSF